MYRTFTLHGTLLAAILSASALKGQAPAIPLWQYKVEGPSNQSTSIGKTLTYTGSIVGRSPYEPQRGTTTIEIALVPVKLVFPAQPPAIPGGQPIPEAIFDPAAISCVANRTPVDIAQKSPLFNDADYEINGADIGHTQYLDAFQRANFWHEVKGTDYHLLFKLKTLPVITVHVPSDKGSSFAMGGCFIGHSLNFGSVDQVWFDDYLRTTLLPTVEAEGVGPDVLPVFYLDTIGFTLPNPIYADSVSYSYHGGVKTSRGIQFYAAATFNAAGTTPPTSGVPAPDQPLTDELVTWVNNPYSTNQTPPWGWIGYDLGCFDSYAVSWPLAQYSTKPVRFNDFTYTETEQTFFSWFFDQTPSLGAGGLYSDSGSLTSPASAQGCLFAN